MKPKHQRLAFVVFSLTFLMLAALFTLQAFKDNIVFFYSPTELKGKPAPQSGTMRLGGLVKEGSLEKGEGNRYAFIITDGNAEIPVRFEGLVPNLFREGQGVIAEGMLEADGTFKAKHILAKHDERYMPKEVVESLKDSGVWRGEPR